MGLITSRTVRTTHTQRSWALADARWREGFIAAIRAISGLGLVRVMSTDGFVLEELTT